MAITTDGMDRAEVTYCYQMQQQRMADGTWAQTEICLPWAFVRFADAGEEKRYVTTRYGDSVGLTEPGGAVLRQVRETMRNAPFPHEVDRGSGVEGDLLKAGPIAIHFFGPI